MPLQFNQFVRALMAGGGGADLSWPGWDDAIVWNDVNIWSD